ncbi:sulfite exporter TauE/SafE family protein [Arthrobacter jiangjiafuii]|uniref:Probable membrane transporter protein n=1 Tax=Arthrobacter jiangjiafuii TaxID=2817475 RepID=A0A975R1S4_9MICC|nr:sulfite exporter TauE/SafE family protein [Arthrobacter jiangjiafuii]MBP3043831.1 sulfite exporter TauE/SafE family protein [Arthrobacter jiangjiafuii]QWC10848.1 sulfite exporter TauE/SafE family protein [Arthrobacter jiangjiafuii]
MTTGLLIVVLVAVFIGAIAQRIAGLGFALLISPFLVILLGSHGGVLMVNVCGLVSSALIMFRVWKDIDWSMYRWLAVPAVIGSVPASAAAVYLPAGPMAVVVGAVVLAALSVSLLMQRTSVTVTGNGAKAVAGFVSGVTNAVAGVGGPSVSAYALMARWPQRPFAATLQPFFVTIAVVTLTAKISLDPGQMPPFQAWAWALIALMIIGGIYAGEKLQRFIRDDQARAAVVVIAFFGAAAALTKGIIDLVA